MKCISFAVAVFLCSSMALGKDLRFAKNLKKSRELQTFVAKTTKKIAPQCANFSGNWKGKCIEQNGDSYDDEIMIIQEDCTEISFGGLFIPFNGSASIHYSPSEGSGEAFGDYSGTIAMSWNDSQTTAKSLMTLTFANGGLAGITSQSMWLEADVLRVKDTFGTPFMDVDGPTVFKPVLSDCTYNRVP